jgi:hypothetical protein
MAVTIVATAVLLSAVAASFVRSLWIKLIRQVTISICSAKMASLPPP